VSLLSRLNEVFRVLDRRTILDNESEIARSEKHYYIIAETNRARDKTHVLNGEEPRGDDGYPESERVTESSGGRK
jgi:hypothetical protein